MSRHTGHRLDRRSLVGRAATLAIAIALALAAVGCASKGGTHDAEAANGRNPSLKTASIKLDEDTACCAMTLSKDRFVATESAIDMIMLAYGEQRPLKPAQVLGGPDWIKTEVLTIDAELPKSLSDQVKGPLHAVGPSPGYPVEVPGTDVVKQVFRSLLINRFKLRIKRETRVLPVYELVLANRGPKIGEGVNSCDFDTFVGLLAASPELRSRVLMDETGLHGRYSFKLHWTPKMPPGMTKATIASQRSQSAAPSHLSNPPLFIAVREQLGLKVQSARATVDSIAIQHIEDPAKN